jgi:metal-responsive CopG/Arc/MetJ family transcriptional regulator
MMYDVYINLQRAIMRALVDIPDSQLDELSDLCATKKQSRAAIIREAIAAYLLANKPAPEQTFGLWANQAVDGMAYQEQARAEW